jgi:hypothetical protein
MESKMNDPIQIIYLDKNYKKLPGPGVAVHAEVIYKGQQGETERVEYFILDDARRAHIKGGLSV